MKCNKSEKSDSSKCVDLADESNKTSRLYGIRSYLHSFYVSADPDEEEDANENESQSSNKHAVFLTKQTNRGQEVTQQEEEDDANDDDEDDDEEEDEDDDDEDETVQFDSTFANLPRQCRKLQKKSRRRLRQSVRRSKQYVHDLKLKFNELNAKQSVSKSYFCLYRCAFTFGISSLVIALIGLIVVCTVSERTVIVARQEEMEIFDESALAFNNNLIILRTISLLFAAFGMLMICCIFVLPLVYGVKSTLTDECLTDEETKKGHVYVKVDQTEFVQTSECPDALPITSIPVLEQISAVQPERQANESVVTHCGITLLTK